MMTKGRTIDVLVVDDSASVLPQICDLLSNLKYVGRVRAAPSRAEALSALSQHEFQVVLVDLQLKQDSGLGILKSMRLSNRKPVIVAFTDHPSPQYREHALASGASYFLDQAYLDSLPAVLESLVSE